MTLTPIRTAVHSVVQRARCHRLFVILPVVALVFCLTVREGVSPVTADLGVGEWSSAEEPRTVTQPRGLRGILQPRSTLRATDAGFVLERGTLLLDALGAGHVSVAEIRATVLAGSMQVTSDAASLTVVAVTAPVLVAEGSERMLIPVGSQWRRTASLSPLGGDIDAWTQSRAVQPLPRHYVEEQLAHLKNLPVHEDEEEGATVTQFIDFLRLPASRERAEAEREQSVLEQLGWLAVRGDDSAVEALLRDEARSSALAAASAEEVAFVVGSLTASRQLPFVLPQLPRFADLWALAALHPVLSDHVWAGEMPTDLADPAVIAAVLTFPASDLTQHLLPLTVDRWSQVLGGFLLTREDALPLFSSLLASMDVQIRSWHEGRYPDRAQLFASALSRIAEPFAEELPLPSLEILKNFSSLDRIGTAQLSAQLAQPEIQPDAAALAPSPASPVPPARPLLSAEEVRTKTVAALDAAGTLMTSRTSIEPRDDGRAVVRNVVLATVSGDREVHFTYDAVTHEAVEVQKDGIALPYAVPFAQFIEWVRGGMR